VQLDDIIRELIKLVESVTSLKRIDNNRINQVINNHIPEGERTANRKYSKKNLLPHYTVKGRDFWGIDKETEEKLISVLQIKPRRSASGVATITVMTKPWPCNSACVYCPNDLRMPKSYLTDEPVCQRAEFVYFDPYLQIESRLRALMQMGHPTDKIEVIVLGGTWSDYPEDYQKWYIKELFRALNESEFSQSEVASNNEDYNTGDNDFGNYLDNQFKIIKNSTLAERSCQDKIEYYKALGFTNDKPTLANDLALVQNDVYEQKMTYNEGFSKYYKESSKWSELAKMQTATIDEVKIEHQKNENASHRCVGLVIETRPDTLSSKNLTLIRELGCTKVQMGVQSLNQEILACNRRNITIEKISQAHHLLRLFGFKIHIHFMVNLFTATVEKDIADYLELVRDPRFLPDEIKLYPCMLIQGTGLVSLYDEGSWTPYSEEDLIKVLVEDTLNTPRYARISRMIRDFSSHDIVAGNKKTNLRQVVEQCIASSGQAVLEIRSREVGTSNVDTALLSLKTTPYETEVSQEYFLEWVTQDDKVAGFLRLSLPHQGLTALQVALPVNECEAMIREVHIYGRTVGLHENDSAEQGQKRGQHRGLGRALIDEACKIAAAQSYKSINVISAVGTREYYRRLGFSDTENGLYLNKGL
jgi:elongator complex protein 3